jgi:L-lactate utilization protein LutB
VDLEETVIQEAFDSYAAELTEEDLGQLIVLIEPEDEHSDTVVEGLHLTSMALKKGRQMAKSNISSR